MNAVVGVRHGAVLLAQGPLGEGLFPGGDSGRLGFRQSKSRE